MKGQAQKLLKPMATMKTVTWPTNIDWSLNNVTLAKQIGCAHSTVQHQRKMRAPQTAFKRQKYDWSKVTDWNQRTDIIAKIVGCSESRVTMYRHEQGIKPGPRKPGSGLWKCRNESSSPTAADGAGGAERKHGN
jgi:hypothetical protein